ncbi:MAG: RDD family protein [Proteobacteria bacterium]|nr:RDD family protein [Pseudomonadota bacterium]
MNYAGFWRRVGAGIIDNVILHIMTGIVLSFCGISLMDTIDTSNLPLLGINSNINNNTFVDGVRDTGNFLQITLSVEFVFLWLYYAFFQSSKYQATPGMMVLSMRIVTYAGEKISFWRASGRFLATYLSWMIAGIGFLMIAFTPRKQGLHDYIAKTLVIKS